MQRKLGIIAGGGMLNIKIILSFSRGNELKCKEN